MLSILLQNEFGVRNMVAKLKNVPTRQHSYSRVEQVVFIEHHIVQQCLKRRIDFVAFAPSVHVHNDPLFRNGDASCRADVGTASK